MDEFLSLSLMFMLAIECDQNVRTFWLCFTLYHQPAVGEPVSAGPEMITHFTYMFYSTLHLTVRYTIQYLTPYRTLYLTVRYTLQNVIPCSTLYLTVHYTLYNLTPFTTLYLTLPYDPQVLQHNRKLSESPLTRMLRH